MNNPKRVFQILLGNKIFCNICLKDIEDEHSYYFKDQIALDIDEYIELSDLLGYILETDAGSIYTSGILCQQCLNIAIASYKFINMCKHNLEHFSNTLALLEGRINSIVKKEEISNKTLFILLKHDTQSLFYDNHSEEYESIASDCLESLNDVEQEIEVKTRKRKSYKISLNDIIFDTNNISDNACKICQNNYSNMIRLKEHFLRVHAPKTYTCRKCSKSYGSSTLLAQHKYGSHKTFMCSHCGNTYIGKSKFRAHLQTHKTELICKICSKSFKQQRSFDNHIKNICNPDNKRHRIDVDKKYICDYCGKCYNSKPNLRSHIRLQHENGKAHVCPWCGKKFKANSILKGHIVTHTKEKKFCCDLCGGRFVTKASLLYHTRIHTGETPYDCKYCERKFLSSSRRAEHVRRHHREPMIECNLCDSKFRSKSCLNRHRKRHFNPSSKLHLSQIMSDDKDNSAPLPDGITCL